MNKKLITHLVCVIAVIVAAAMMFASFVGFIMKDSMHDVLTLLLCGLASAAFLVPVVFFTKPRSEIEKKSGMREGFAIVTLSWIGASVVGMLPFIFVTGMNPVDAFFETVSGFTTTGASIIDNTLELMNGKTLPEGVQSLSYGILFWRCLTHWLGGMGIVVLFIAILPLMNIGGQSLYNAEVTGIKSVDSQIAPRIASSAKILWFVYVFLTAVEAVLLYFGGMTFFDSVCHSFSTMATGGFSTKQASIAYYNSAYIDWVITIFMFLAGCNFMLHFRFFTGRLLGYFKDEEFRFYFALVVFATLIITLFLIFTPRMEDTAPNGTSMYYEHPLTSLRYAAFQVVSLITSTGFATANYALWPSATCVLLFVLMFIGGCGGSTGGGMKCVRALLLGKHSYFEVKRCILPHMIPDIRLNGKRFEMSTIQKTIAFVSLYIFAYFVFVLILPVICPSMTYDTALSASVACLSNIGPGFGQVGPANTFAWMTPAAKLLLSLEMILGRLELYTVLVLFLPSFWRK